MSVPDVRRSDATVFKVADEEDWLNLLIASERVSEWLDILRWGQAEQKIQTAQKLLKEVQTQETYIEEAKAAGAVGLLTTILRKSDDEELCTLAAAIITACSGHSAGGKRVQEIQYGRHVVKIQEGALGDGLGARVWVAAHCLCRHLEAHPELVKGLDVLELGSGCGLSGLLAAKLGAKQVTLTDYEEPVLLNLQACMAANLASSGHHAESDSHGSPDLSSRCLNSSILNGAENIGAHVKGQCSGSSDTCGNSKETAKMLWQTDNARVCFLDWIEALPVEERSSIMQEDMLAGRERSLGGPPALPTSQKFPTIIGSDLIYELYHSDMVAAVISQRLEKSGKAYIAMAVRRQALLDRLIKAAGRVGLCIDVEPQDVDPEAVGIVGRENEYEGGFVLLTVSLATQ